jgi:hypothetical protein
VSAAFVDSPIEYTSGGTLRFHLLNTDIFRIDFGSSFASGGSDGVWVFYNNGVEFEVFNGAAVLTDISNAAFYHINQFQPANSSQLQYSSAVLFHTSTWNTSNSTRTLAQAGIVLRPISAALGTIASGNRCGGSIDFTGSLYDGGVTPVLIASIDFNSGYTGGGTKYLSDDGTYKTITAAPSAANPTASVGLSIVNGSASTFMRSDGAPALSQSISPTWTGTHSFNLATYFYDVTGANYTRLMVKGGDSGSLSAIIDVQKGGSGTNNGILIQQAGSDIVQISSAGTITCKNNSGGFQFNNGVAIRQDTSTPSGACAKISSALIFGTSSFASPEIANDGTDTYLIARYSNGSGNAPIHCAEMNCSFVKTANPTSGTAANWKMGSRITGASVSLDTAKYVELDVGGTLVKLLIAA